MKPVVIIGVIVACSIFSLAVGLSSDNIFSNQNGSEIQKEELKVELEQEDSIPKTLQKSSENISYDFDSVTTINIEIYGDTFDFSAKQFQPFELTFSDEKFKISESAIGTNLGDFLMSYGLSLDDKCLVFVYENKSYCTTESDTLSYFINDNPVSNIAYYKINQGQEIEIKFKNKMWTDEGYVIFNENLEKESKIQVERVVDAENQTYSDEISSISTIEVEIYGDEFNFAAEKYGLFALEYTYPELRGNHKFTIPEYAIGNSIGNFFNSYALSLDDQCLKFIYEDRSFCSNDSFMLTYFINGNPVSNIAYYEIDHGQEIEIKFNADYSNKSLKKELKIQKDRVDGAQKRAIEESSNNNGIEQNKPFSNVENAVKPQMVFNKEIIEMTLYDSKNNKYFWTMPVTTYETQVKIDGYPTMPVKTNTGQITIVGDFRPFVQTSFSNVIDDVYANLEKPDYFVYEIWYMVSKLTIYSLDIGEEPRFALETLVRGGGDCEDTVILIADMIRSSSHTKDWKLQLVYFDSHNPTNPQQINHVALLIDDGEYRYVIETTAKTSEGVFYTWSDTNIVGLFLDV